MNHIMTVSCRSGIYIFLSLKTRAPFFFEALPYLKPFDAAKWIRSFTIYTFTSRKDYPFCVKVIYMFLKGSWYISLQDHIIYRVFIKYCVFSLRLWDISLYEIRQDVYRFHRAVLNNFSGRKIFRISYLKTVLESWIPGQKNYHLRFSSFSLFRGQIFVWNLKLPSKTAKLPSKMQIAGKDPGPTAYIRRIFIEFFLT